MPNPEQTCHRLQRRLLAGERLIKEQMIDICETAANLNVPQARCDALQAKRQAVLDALKEFHDEGEAACLDIGVTPQSSPGDKD